VFRSIDFIDTWSTERKQPGMSWRVLRTRVRWRLRNVGSWQTAAPFPVASGGASQKRLSGARTPIAPEPGETSSALLKKID